MLKKVGNMTHREKGRGRARKMIERPRQREGVLKPSRERSGEKESLSEKSTWASLCLESYFTAKIFAVCMAGNSIIQTKQ